jgi:hypothetical protein
LDARQNQRLSFQRKNIGRGRAMKTNTRVALSLAIAAAAQMIACLAGVGEPARAAGLTCTGVPSSGNTTYNPISCTVNCAQGGKIASALAYAPRTGGGLTITINGTCTEAVNLANYNGITLQGGSSGGTIQAPSSSTNPVVGLGGQDIILNDFTISGGVVGLDAHDGAHFSATNLVIEGASSNDLELNGAHADLTNSTIEDSGANGVEGDHGAVMYLNGGAIRGNAQYGVQIYYASSLDVYGGAVIENNGIAGAEAGDGGSIVVSAGTIQKNGAASGGLGGLLVGTGGHVRLVGTSSSVVNNAADGIALYRGGTVLVDSGAMVANNAGNGLFMWTGGVAGVRAGSVIKGNGGNELHSGIYVESGAINIGDGTGPAIIENNKGNGIHLGTNSVAIFANSGNQIINNGGWGILCAGAPSNPVGNGNPGTVSGNKAGQISCKFGD